MDIQAASIEQVSRGRDGKFVEIDADVGEVAQRLREIDSRLRLRFSEAGGYFVVYRVLEQPDGSTKQDLVTTAQELDARLIERIEKVYGRDYNYGAELMAVDDEAKRAADHAMNEHFGAMAEKLAHAFRKDMGVRSTKIYVPRGVPR